METFLSIFGAFYIGKSVRIIYNRLFIYLKTKNPIKFK
jgi:hypothetical protein